MRTSRLTRSFASVGAAVLLAVSLSACGGDDETSSNDPGSSGGDGPVEAADTPQETMRRLAPLAMAGNYEDACLLMSNDEQAFATYPGLMDSCVNELAPTEFDDLSEEDWAVLTETPEERIELAASGENPQLRYHDESANEVGYAEFREIDGLVYFAFVELRD